MSSALSTALSTGLVPLSDKVRSPSGPTGRAINGSAGAATFLTAEEVAERYRTSLKSIHDRTRTNRIPYVKRDGFRRMLFPVSELEAWDAGAALELVELADGRAVRCTQSVRNDSEAA
jgi:hypothetical protein